MCCFQNDLPIRVVSATGEIYISSKKSFTTLTTGQTKPDICQRRIARHRQTFQFIFFVYRVDHDAKH